ncbi:ring-cleaving dioxygenase [Microlunatus capsulatus]|uniref:Glyoxalase family protein n=1 Tax=Microlunatus capsulatus TaxID=99117 RepID=A0ABS4Z6S9_9ACTN|nr:ring-cleaving dioxygenase [Microlunatus capsulatus]MBP2416762.1 glyoxalase family protein [Microlunatus capsulatus]
MSTVSPRGLHHVTAIASDPQANVDFYTTLLGLRLVKQTVNFDAPNSYHLYYGDAAGSPSSLLTFFPWPGVPRGRSGAGMMTATAFSVPGSSLGWWHERFRRLGVDVDAPRSRDTEEVLAFRDPDGMGVELVATEGDHRSGWDGVADIPAEHAVRGLHAVTLSEQQLDPSAAMLTRLMGLTLDAEDGDRVRFGMADRGAGGLVDVLAGVQERGRQAGGTVHHVAFRAPDLETMTRWQGELVDGGVRVTQILDRQYFKSIYFREPGGVLFEIATDDPGFATDEPLLELGRHLRLPPWLEPSREQIAAALPPLRLPPQPTGPEA